MKKIFSVLALGAISLGFGQYYPQSGKGDWGTEVYSNEDGYFPDDYYYEYPTDYYSDDYYQGYYSDYRRSISAIDWNRFFYEYNLSPQQISMVMDLNRRFDSYAMWSNYYRMNPDRWYYDRFYALQNILGRRVYVVFRQKYYNGYDPVDYFRSYRTQHYSNVYYVRPRYRNTDISRYWVDRNRYQGNNGIHYGWDNSRNPHNPGGFKNDNGAQNRVFRNENSQQQNSVFRNENRSSDGGFRQRTQQMPEERPQNMAPQRNSGGFRNGSEPRREASPETQRNQNGGRNGGFRQNFTSM